jgi:hypothetical protein
MVPLGKPEAVCARVAGAKLLTAAAPAA